MEPSFYEAFHRDTEARLKAHEEQMQTMREQLSKHEERIAYNEETQRRVSNALQALREILGRENGR